MAVRQATELQNAATERRLSSSKSPWHACGSALVLSIHAAGPDSLGTLHLLSHRHVLVLLALFSGRAYPPTRPLSG